MLVIARASASSGFVARNAVGNLWRGLASSVQPATEVQLQHLDGDLQGVAVIGLQRAAAKNSFRFI